MTTVVADLERRVTELRFIEGVEKVEHVPYLSGDQFWVRLNRPLDLNKFGEVVKKNGYVMVNFASLLSKLPRGIAELLWDGITHVVVKKISAWSRFTSKLGFEPDGIAKLAIDLHGPYRIFIATEEEGIPLLYEYLDLKYVPPIPPTAMPTSPIRPPSPQPAASTPTAITQTPLQPTQAKTEPT
jgi:hypothetical protein